MSTSTISLSDIRRTVYELTAPAREALSPAGLLNLERDVTALVRAHRLEAARALIEDEIRLACIDAELIRHAESCETCAAGNEVACFEYGRQEAQAACVQNAISAVGGL